MNQSAQEKAKAPLRYRMAMVLYQVALAAAMPLVWRYFRRRAVKDPAYGKYLDERRGAHSGGQADVWIHAVSLGEFRSAMPVIEALLREGVKIVLTHATPAGRSASEAALAEPIAAGQVQVRYAPIDRISAWERFFRTAAPRVGLVFEMEFWPGMTEASVKAGVDLWFVNAQIPKKSFPSARAVFRYLGAHPVSRATGVYAKSTRMAERFRALSAPQVLVAGETRFDIAAPKKQIVEGKALKESLGARPVFAFASVVEGEEAVYLRACTELVERLDHPLIIWVPRAPEAFERTCELLERSGLRKHRRSMALSADFEPLVPLADVDVLVGDSFGEMFAYLSAADVVSVGGGFVEKGAHNVIEPLALGKPVVTGPHVWTIEYPGREARDAGVLTVCDDPMRLTDALIDARNMSPELAEAFHKSNLGASDAITAMVMGTLERHR